VFTARYALSPYIKQIHFVFKGLREEHGHREIDNGEVRKILGSKREEVIGSWAKVYNVELHVLYPPLNTVRVVQSWRLKQQVCGNIGLDATGIVVMCN
jgi:hypothetical protein